MIKLITKKKDINLGDLLGFADWLGQNSDTKICDFRGDIFESKYS